MTNSEEGRADGQAATFVAERGPSTAVSPRRPPGGQVNRHPPAGQTPPRASRPPPAPRFAQSRRLVAHVCERTGFFPEIAWLALDLSLGFSHLHATAGLRG